jgi:hypothetical protein
VVIGPDYNGGTAREQMVANRNGKHNDFSPGKIHQLPRKCCKNNDWPAPGRLGVEGSNPFAPTKFLSDFNVYSFFPVIVLPPVATAVAIFVRFSASSAVSFSRVFWS